MVSLLKIVQILCVILLSCLGLWIGFLGHGEKKNISGEERQVNRVFYDARTMILIGISCAVLHFIVQSILHGIPENISSLRTLINLLFGFPITFFMTFAVVYLQRRGKLYVWEWLVVPLFYFASIIVALLLIFVFVVPDGLHITNVIVSVFYTLVLGFCCVLLFMCYRQSNLDFQYTGNDNFIPILRWSRWIFCSQIIVSFGFPFMTFCQHDTLRAFHELLTLVVGLLYCIAFVLVGKSTVLFASSKSENEWDASIHGSEQDADEQSKQTESLEVNNTPMSGQDFSHVEPVVADFVAGDFYLKSGITIRDVAHHMHLTPAVLRAWLHTTEYDKFNNWLVAIRLMRAKQMLLNERNLTNKEIAHRCGFCDRYYFQSQFRKVEGMSPSQWLAHTVKKQTD